MGGLGTGSSCLESGVPYPGPAGAVGDQRLSLRDIGEAAAFALQLSSAASGVAAEMVGQSVGATLMLALERPDAFYDCNWTQLARQHRGRPCSYGPL